MSDHSSLRECLDMVWMLKRRIAELEGALSEALECWQDDAHYKYEFLRAKHGDQDTIERLRSLLQDQSYLAWPPRHGERE